MLLEKIMQKYFDTSAFIGGRPLCNLLFAEDIDLLRDSKEEVQQLTERLEKAAAGYGMEISSDKSKIFVNSIKPRLLGNISMDEWKSAKWASSNT